MELIVSEKIAGICKKLGIELPKESDISYVYISKKDKRKLGYLDQTRYEQLMDYIMEQYFKYDSIGDKKFRAKDLLGRWFPQIREQGFEVVTKKTYIGRAGKVLRKMIPDISETKVQEFSMKFYEENYEFIVRKDVTEVYNCRIDSCMQGHDMSFYEDNGVKILTLVRNGAIEGRALLWENIDSKKKTYLDREYVFDCNDTELFKAYAEKNNWDHYYNKGDQELIYKLKHTEADFYPYMDTMLYLNKSEGILSSEEGEFVLEMTDGVLEDDEDMVFSEWHGESIREDEAVLSVYLGDYLIRCCSVWFDDDWFPEDFIGDKIIKLENGSLCWYEQVVETVDGKFYNEDVVVEIDEDWYYIDDSKIVETDDGYCLKENVIKLGGTWYIKNSNDVVFCETTQRYRINRTKEFSFKEQKWI